MQKVHISKVTPGMVLAQDIYNDSDQLVLPEGLKLNDKSIAKLTYYGIMFVRVQDPTGDEMPVQEAASDSEMGDSYNERLKKTEEFKVFKEQFESSVAELENVLSDVVERNMPPDTTDLMGKINEMLHPKGGSINVFDMIRNMKTFDDMTFSHMLNVGLISAVFGKWLGLNDEQIELATQCGILHDIGKLKIPAEIIKKPGKLTNEEFKIIKTHPTEGYKILHNCPDIDEHIKLACLEHHERVDGSGYPMAITGEQMDYYAKLVGIADVYEAMTAVRIYRGSLSPFQVIEIFESEGLQKYDTQMIMTFLENICNTYMLNRVRLSDGREGDLIFVNKQKLSRPVIKCGNTFVDLMKEPELSIVAII